MKIFVATKPIQGYKAGDFGFVPEGEMVSFLICEKVWGCRDRACWRALTGLKTHKGVTTFKVVECDITPAQFAEMIFRSMKECGWLDSKVFLLSEEEGRAISQKFSRTLSRAAAKFPVGTLCQKRGRIIEKRT